MNRQPDIATFLDWDSTFFGVRIARVTAARLDAASAAPIVTWRTDQRIDCLYFLADANDPASGQIAEQIGFRFVDIRVTLDCKLREVPLTLPLPAPFTLRAATLDDLPALESIARQSYRQSRFYADGHFAPERCDDLYAKWIANAVHANAATTLVVVNDAQPIGYLSCHLHGETGQIDLMGIHSDFQGRGIGTMLWVAGLARLYAAGGRAISVVTQGRNLTAQRLYQKHGFRTAAVALWYHWWANDRA
ncbi:MAG: GNAT family N-acetyltransferase [Chloroflexota bacterium]|nr:GNAT family N-acetyltransferase [Chloroflexota bacterium]